MSHEEMPLSHQSGKDTGLSFPNAYLAIEVVAIHQRESVEEVVDGGFVDGFLG